MIPHFDKKKLADLAQHHQLRFVILHGSYATGKEHSESDIDIAVVPKDHMDMSALIALYGPFAMLFEAAEGSHEIDLKSMEGTDPLFRYEVIRDGMLLYGDPLAYEEYKAVSRRMYEDAQPLFELERTLVHKYQKYLNTHSHA